jgi:hypothetical protein
MTLAAIRDSAVSADLAGTVSNEVAPLAKFRVTVRLSRAVSS